MSCKKHTGVLVWDKARPEIVRVDSQTFRTVETVSANKTDADFPMQIERLITISQKFLPNKLNCAEWMGDRVE